MANPTQASEWLLRWQHLLAPQSQVLDLACGTGRHLRHFAALGHRMTGVDQDAAALAPLHGTGELICADLEAASWPLAGREFDAVIVTNYLWRAHWPQLRACVAPGGVLLYETFAHGNAAYGHPARPAFLLQPGELLQLCHGWHIVAYEHGLIPTPGAQRIVQRIAAIRPSADTSSPQARPLSPT